MALTRNIDLHLLECFDVLLRERSVSRAAESLGVSQSSASEMLARLRERLGDPLLVRVLAAGVLFIVIIIIDIFIVVLVIAVVVAMLLDELPPLQE
ncbi:MAG: helix-turn-helix domain-containing protein, partial [Rubrivivax sp.]